MNGAYIEDKKGNVIYSNKIAKDKVERVYYLDQKKLGIDYGLVGSHAAKLSRRTEMISQAIDPIYPNLEVDPDFYQKEDIYQMWTFEEQGDDLVLPESLASTLRMVRWHEHSSDVVPISGSKAAGVAKVVDQLGLNLKM